MVAARKRWRLAEKNTQVEEFFYLKVQVMNIILESQGNLPGQISRT